ncbi:DUF1045 domain-containing protein [Rhizobium sp. FY34]|uniref:DUF1045 domain-containing protein n=1 Tax=Rhizobium sp. FY34 TaxID=2562309 RepID=UPI0010C0A659|nr:DUF1045 domain-containing protein [Rhizobium sp. FY34]
MRYALYFSPPQNDPLTVAASTWLGRHAFSDNTLPSPDIEGLTVEDWRDLTADPRRYGFHATLKAPFALAPSQSPDMLFAAFDRFCATTPAARIDSLVLSQLGPFFALVPGGSSQDVDQLCARIVETFEPFRAPLSAADIARRKPERMTQNQRSHLERWGYPYVFDEFRFHMTLTGPVSDERQPQMRSLLEQRFAAFTGQPLAIAHLALFVETQAGAPFTIQRHRALCSAAIEDETTP